MSKRSLQSENALEKRNQELQSLEEQAIYANQFKHILVRNETENGHSQLIENILLKYGTEIYGNLKIKLFTELKSNPTDANLFKSVSFFPKSQFKIDANTASEALNVFSPLVDSILNRSLNLPSQSIVIQILVYGFTDATGLAPKSELNNALLPYMKHKSMTKENINLQLSFLRAQEIGKILSQLIENRKKDFDSFDKVFIQIVNEGKGEELPDQIRRYKVDDVQRRIVKIFWKVTSV